ncbi:O-antigen ligase family protein [soil metagenome]
MTYTASADISLPSHSMAPGVVTLQHALLWLVGFGGAFVFVEPSPYEIAMVGAMVVFFAAGLRLQRAFVPLLILLFLVNIGYTICAADLLDKQPILNWILTSWYMAFAAIFFAMALSENTAARLDLLRRGMIAGAVITSLLGIAGYLSLFPGANSMFTLYGRAAGAFKDPNVLGAFLVLPGLFALQSVVSDGFWRSSRSIIALGIITLAILLAFSRAAWGLFVLSAAFMLFTMVLTSASNKQRTRIIIMTLGAIVAVILLIGVLLSIDSIADMFKQRASFDQKYDEGRFGRFGRHYLGAQMALELPFGIGPLQFTKFFPEDTHNSYLNAFMSGGWISGVCFPALLFITVGLGFRLIFVRVPWQRAYLAVFAAFLGTVGEAFIIDVDHWRHFWMMLGIMWAMFVAARQYAAAMPGSSEASAA